MSLKSANRKDRSECVIELLEDDKPLGHITLGAPELESLIDRLSMLRSHLSEQVIPDLDHGARIAVVSDPAWRVPGDDGDQNRVLLLRHPGHGWLGFAFPQKEAGSLAEGLTTDFSNKKN